MSGWKVMKQGHSYPRSSRVVRYGPRPFWKAWKVATRPLLRKAVVSVILEAASVQEPLPSKDLHPDPDAWADPVGDYVARNLSL